MLSRDSKETGSANMLDNWNRFYFAYKKQLIRERRGRQFRNRVLHFRRCARQTESLIRKSEEMQNLLGAKERELEQIRLSFNFRTKVLAQQQKQQPGRSINGGGVVSGDYGGEVGQGRSNQVSSFQ